MSGIADEKCVVAHPREALDGDKRSRRMLVEVLKQARHVSDCIRKFFSEKLYDLLIPAERSKGRLSFEGQEKGAGKTAIRVWQCDHHKALARPDVQGVLFKDKTTI